MAKISAQTERVSWWNFLVDGVRNITYKICPLACQRNNEIFTELKETKGYKLNKTSCDENILLRNVRMTLS